MELTLFGRKWRVIGSKYLEVGGGGCGGKKKVQVDAVAKEVTQAESGSGGDEVGCCGAHLGYWEWEEFGVESC